MATGKSASEMLQWGRVRLNAETPVLQKDGTLRMMLQWGRVRLNAETRQWRNGEETATRGFNGAAFG